MRAVILATGYQSQLVPLVHHIPSPLMKVADKPILFHLLEYCHTLGIQKVDIVLHHLPEMIREKIGRGSRWGLSIHYHLARDPECPWDPLRGPAIDWPEESVFVMQGDSLPLRSLPITTESRGCLSGTPSWAVIRSQELTQIARGTRWNELASKLSLPVFPDSENSILAIEALPDLKEANLRFLQETLPTILPPSTAREVEKGVWVSTSASIHPSAKLNAPVFIGRNCQIAPNTEVGPNAIVENNSIVDGETHIEDSLVCQNSYVGQHLQIRNSVVDRRWILNLERGTHLEIHDDWIVDDLTFPELKHRFIHLLERVVAVLIILMTSPLLLTLWGIARLHGTPRVMLPAKTYSSNLPTFQLWSFVPRWKSLERFLPKTLLHLPFLLNIAQGNLHFVGVTPRRPERVKSMPFDWQTLYLDSKAGWFTLSYLEHGRHPSLDDEYVSEVYYIARSNPLLDLKILWRYLWPSN